ncbi:hypothetical protein AY601_2224 [Pedobacter cryoconitis]|uniref:Polymerase nucleotidyl transferase domain-containing protein n=1 Tax=Pedobacter cryoconitis TaxID=188932 RepID=A0A127VD19_9SPHI|nr:aminoglycoside 6-adenylyltransferase [Pedobacter cryoconitis]AMP99121.1 hypothetical protein AY601_2224 [Pedobacter cryoconitis]
MGDLNRVTEDIIALARNSKDIYGVISFGSSNRKTKDKYSDLDIFLFTSNPEKYLADENNDLLKGYLGEILSRVVVKDFVDHVMVIKLMLKDGTGLDIITVNISEFSKTKYYLFLKKHHLSGLLPNKIKKYIDTNIHSFYYFLKRGHTILYDSMNLQQIVTTIFELYRQDIKDEELNILDHKRFFNNYHQFWQGCYHFHLKLAINDPLCAKLMLDHMIKVNLIQVVNWHTLLFKNEQKDIFYYGAKLNEWCDETIIQRLYDIFPHRNVEEMRKSILNTIKLYQQLSQEISTKKNYEIINTLEQFVIKSIQMSFKFNETDKMVYPDQLTAMINNHEDVKIVLSYNVNGSIETMDALEINRIFYVDNLEKYLNEETWENIFGNILSIVIRKSSIRNSVEILLNNGQLIQLKLEKVKDLYALKRIFYLKKGFPSFFISQRHKKYATQKNDFLKQDLKKGYTVLKDTIAGSDFFEVMRYKITSSEKGRPTTAMFYKNYHCFWQNSYKLMVKLHRKDFFYAIVILDHAVKKYLLEMVKWSHLDEDQPAKLAADIHPIKEWCINEMQDKLMLTLPHSNIEEMKRAIMNSMELYKEVSVQVSEALGIELDIALQVQVYELVNNELLKSN